MVFVDFPEHDALVNAVTDLLSTMNKTQAAMVDGLFEKHGSQFVRDYFNTCAKGDNARIFEGIANKFVDGIFKAHKECEKVNDVERKIHEQFKKAVEARKAKAAKEELLGKEPVKKVSTKDLRPTIQELRDVQQKRNDFIDALAEKYARSGLYGDRKAMQKAHEYLQAKVTAYGDAHTEEKEDSAK